VRPASSPGSLTVRRAKSSRMRVYLFDTPEEAPPPDASLTILYFYWFPCLMRLCRSTALSFRSFWFAILLWTDFRFFCTRVDLFWMPTMRSMKSSS